MSVDKDFDDNCEISKNLTENSDIQHAILQNVKKRFLSNNIYTFSGKLLIALNPFQFLSLYSNDVAQAYRVKPDQNLPPHIFSIGNKALSALKERKKPQCIVVTGESGSGKTVTANHLTQFLYKKEEKLAVHIATVLEAFGNCSTPQNDNSSRFVKLLQFHYSLEYEVLKLNITYQLFEQTRLCMNIRTAGDNFNVFYMLLNAPMDLKAKLNITNENFGILPSKDGCNQSKYTFNELDNALDGLGPDISGMRNSIYSILAALLHLGNVNFKADQLGFAQINDIDDSYIALERAAYLLAINVNEIESVLLERKLIVGADSISVKFNETLAATTRDSIMKIIYCELFRFLINTVNGQKIESQQYVGILDIAGFECFGTGENCFEQLCINFVNEKIRHFSTNRLIKEEVDWYKSENLDIPQIDFLDNTSILDLLENKTNGIFSLLEDESKKKMPSSTNFMKNVINACINNAKFTVPKSKVSSVDLHCFVIHHYSQSVCYTSEHFVEKNTESISTDAYKMIEVCLNYFNINDIKKITGSKSATITMKKELATLMNTLNTNDSHFIHCVKPNYEKLSMKFDDSVVLMQLNTVGVIPIVNLLRYGFAATLTYDQILAKFQPHISNKANLFVEELSQDLLLSMHCDKNGFKFGRTQIFFRPKYEHFVDIFSKLDNDETTKIAKEVSNKFYMRQRHALWIKLLFLDKMFGNLKRKKENREKKMDTEIPIIVEVPTIFASIKEETKREPENQETKIHLFDQCNEVPKKQTTKGKRKPISEKRPAHSLRYDGIDHEIVEDRPRQRCKLERCAYKSYIKCIKCGVHLCYSNKRDCFATFHKL